VWWAYLNGKHFCHNDGIYALISKLGWDMVLDLGDCQVLDNDGPRIQVMPTWKNKRSSQDLHRYFGHSGDATTCTDCHRYREVCGFEMDIREAAQQLMCEVSGNV
jgi:hypothetical protein